MDVKVVRSFYFLSVARKVRRPGALYGGKEDLISGQYCVIGTSTPPIPPPSRKGVENYKKHMKKVESYQLGVERFLDKPNVIEVKTGLRTYQVKLGVWTNRGTKGKQIKHKILGAEVKIGIKSPKMIGKRVTGPGTYFYYKSNLYLAEDSASVQNFVDGPTISSNSQSKKRERIPDEVQIFVWNRDNAECVKCGSNENLAFDHIIPHSLGGSNSKRNLQLLCDTCNQKKGNKIGG